MKSHSYFDGEKYNGYKVSLRRIRENYGEFEPVQLSRPRDVYDFMRDIEDLDREKLYTICLDNKCKVVNCEETSSGTVESTAAHPREVFKSAVLSSSSGIILVHNHTTGDPSPSNEDRLFTKRVYDCGKLMGIELLDHVIIGKDSYYSFMDYSSGNKSLKKYEFPACQLLMDFK